MRHSSADSLVELVKREIVDPCPSRDARCSICGKEIPNVIGSPGIVCNHCASQQGAPGSKPMGHDWSERGCW